MVLATLWLALSAATAWGQASDTVPGPGAVTVRTALGGFILGYDIDQHGNEGLLAEALTLADRHHDVAVETFDQQTGRILRTKHVRRDSLSDYVTFGIFGASVGLVEFEHVTDLYVDRRVYHTMDPLDANHFTGRWTPPLHGTEGIITASASNQDAGGAVMMGFKNDLNDSASYVFWTDVGANTFGPLIRLNDSVFDWSHSPVVAIDTAHHRAVLASSNGCFGCHTRIGQVHLDSGKQLSVAGLGLGFVNGIAVDSSTGIACTTTEDDFSVEFYDLQKGTSFMVTLPGAFSQAQSGAAVAVDPIHHLFLVGQPISSTAPSGSSIHVFDEQGNVVESLNGFSLPASPAPMVLKPDERRGFVIVTPALNQLQSFQY